MLADPALPFLFFWCRVSRWFGVFLWLLGEGGRGNVSNMTPFAFLLTPPAAASSAGAKDDTDRAWAPVKIARTVGHDRGWRFRRRGGGCPGRWRRRRRWWRRADGAVASVRPTFPESRPCPNRQPAPGGKIVVVVVIVMMRWRREGCLVTRNLTLFLLWLRLRLWLRGLTGGGGVANVDTDG